MKFLFYSDRIKKHLFHQYKKLCRNLHNELQGCWKPRKFGWDTPKVNV